MTWDAFFRLWAVLGTLLVAGVAGWWNRKIQRENRKHDVELAAQRDEKQYRRLQASAVKELELNDYEEVRRACMKMLSTSHKLIYYARGKHIEAARHSQGEETVDKYGSTSDTLYGEYLECGNAVTYLADAATAKASGKMYDAAINLANCKFTRGNEARDALWDKYAACRIEFVSISRKFLGELRDKHRSID